MLKQVLITALVAALVIGVARIQRARRIVRQRPTHAPAEEAWYRSPAAVVGLIFAALVMLSTTAVTAYRHWLANQLVEVVVIDPGSGARTLYQVKRKDLGEREFRTIDGRRVSLGAGDRVERLD